MNISDQLKEVINQEVLKKKSLDAAKLSASEQRPITRRSIEDIHDDKYLSALFELECEA